MPGNPAYAGQTFVINQPFPPAPETIVLVGSTKAFWDNASPAGAVTVATLASQGLVVTDPSFIATKVIIEGSPAVFAGAPVQKGTKTGTIPPAAPPKDQITLV